MRIIRAEKSDMKEILALQYAAYQSEAKLVNDFSIPPLKQTYDEIISEYENGVILKSIGETGEIIGSVRAYKDNETVYIGKLIVKPELQGRGTGTKLLFAIEEECPSLRYELFTSDKSIRNIKLYERVGYVKFKEEAVNENLTFVYMEKYKK